MNEQLAENFQKLPDLLGGHILLTFASLAVGLLISLPLGIVTSRRPKLAESTLGIAGVVQTIPSLALLFLMVPLLGGRTGFLPAFVALALYSILPILANTIVGIRGVDPTLIEAAHGLGMSDSQVLKQVQLPLAAPIIISGIRTATVLVVGTATLVTPVGGNSLGNYIFGGLETSNHVATVFGCVMTAVFAVALDQLIRLLELASQRRSRPLAIAGATGLLIVLSGGLYGPVTKLFTPREVVVASAPFTEQHIWSDLLKTKLTEAGFAVDQRQGMSEGVQFLALRHGQIDCCVNYTGNIWSVLMKRTDLKSRKDVYEETSEFINVHYEAVCLGKLGFENAYAIAMRPDRARALLGPNESEWTIAKLAKATQKQRVTFATDLQFLTRPEWPRIRDAYGLRFGKVQEMDPTLMYPAVKSGNVDVICAYTSDGRVDAYGLVLLQDPQEAFPPYDAVLLVSKKAAQRPGFVEALQPLIGAVDVKTMRQANLRVDVDHWQPRRAADWLLERITDGQ